jgi:hypothetical protein
MVEPSRLGYQEAQRQIERFVDELLDEASRVAKRRSAEEASPEHIRMAAEHLFTHSSGRLNNVLMVTGSALFGAAASLFASVVLVTPISAEHVTVSVVLMIIGVVLGVIGMARK